MFRFPPCLFHLATGYYCPGCGGTRAITSLLHGQILNSFLYHPVVLYAAMPESVIWTRLGPIICPAHPFSYDRPFPAHQRLKGFLGPGSSGTDMKNPLFPCKNKE